MRFAKDITDEHEWKIWQSMEERSDWRNIKSPHVYTPTALRLPPTAQKT